MVTTIASPDKGALDSEIDQVNAAATLIQRYVLRRISRRYAMSRKQLYERITVESRLTSGLWKMIMRASVFICVLVEMSLTFNNMALLDVHRNYAKHFDLNALQGIASIPELLSFLHKLSRRADELQAMSSIYFREGEGVVKILSGLHEFDAPRHLSVDGIMPNVDVHSFSFTCWVKDLSRSNASSLVDIGFLVRKPLSTHALEKHLSCWGWKLDSFVFGAHDFGAAEGSQEQEVALAKNTSRSDGHEKLHMYALVATPKRLFFYEDGFLVSNVSIRRPVTDCSGGGLYVGGRGMTLGELTFFPYALNGQQLEEIAFAGFTSEAIAFGHKPRAPIETSFDALRTTSEEHFTDTMDRTRRVQQRQNEEGVISRATMHSVIPPKELVVWPTLQAVPEIGCTRSWPSCSSIKVERAVLDPLTGKEYFNLLPESTRHSPEAKTRMTMPGAGNMHHYEVSSFPRWKGTSATFMTWMRSTGSHWYILAKNSDFESPLRCWTFHLEDNGLATIGGSITAEFPTLGNPFSRIALPPSLGLRFSYMKSLRHIALVFDRSTNSMRAYLDGEFFGENFFEEPDTVARLDCDNTNRTYIGLGHRAPGPPTFKGEIQDLRMYVGSALSSEEIRRIALNESGPVKRECVLRGEGSDSNFHDIVGNDCAWYQEKRQNNQNICLARQVQSECPVACESEERCLAPALLVTTNYVWKRIMHLHTSQHGILCESVGSDVLAGCRKLEAAKDPRSYPDLQVQQLPSWLFDVLQSREEQVHPLVNITDCEMLADMLNPECSFEVVEGTSSFHAQFFKTRQYTITFWIKAVGEQSLTDGEFVPTVSLYSKVAPPMPLVHVSFRTSGVVGAFFEVCDVREDVFLSVGFALDRWVHISLVFGLIQQGKSQVVLMVDSTYGQDSLEYSCHTPPDANFLEAVAVSGDLLISPIAVQTLARTPRELQEMYYETRGKYRVRRGPARESTFGAKVIKYNREPYLHKSSLVAPPILMQARGNKIRECPVKAGSFDLGSEFHNVLWQQTLSGKLCKAPYSCSPELLESSSGLLACTGPSTPDTWFGRTGTPFRRAWDLGSFFPFKAQERELMFTEFLTSITEAPLLVRDGHPISSDVFLDQHTREVIVHLVLFAPQNGILSMLTIHANTGVTLHAGYSLQHFQAREKKKPGFGSELLTAFVVVILSIDIAYKLYRWRDRERHTLFAVANIFVFGIIPISYFVIRLRSQKESMTVLQTIVNRIATVPWSSKRMEFTEKFLMLFEGLDLLQGQIYRLYISQTIGSLMAMGFGLRFINVSAMHPRTAILVRTMEECSDEMAHFLLLLAFLLGMFACLGYSVLGGDHFDFSSPWGAFVTLFKMMIGNLPDNFSSDYRIMAYVVAYEFTVWLVMLNFVIAIIVEGYLKVKRQVEDNTTELAILTDIKHSLVAAYHRTRYGWPRNRVMLEKLDSLCTQNVNLIILRNLFPNWNRSSMLSFIMHYHRFDFLLPVKIVPSQSAQIAHDVEIAIAALLGKSAQSRVESEIARATAMFREERQHSLKTNSSVSSPRHVRSVNL